jgi:hypothetical protein
MASEDVQINTMTTIQNLLPHIGSTAHEYLTLVPSLFSSFYGNRPRTILCSVYEKMCVGNEKISKISEYVSALNSWDAKYLEEPNYERRLAAFRSIGVSLVEDVWDIEMILPILHNCFFFVNRSSDMSLRDASSSCIEAIVRMVASKTTEDQTLFDEVILKSIIPSIVQGLKLKNSVSMAN